MATPLRDRLNKVQSALDPLVETAEAKRAREAREADMAGAEVEGKAEQERRLADVLSWDRTKEEIKEAARKGRPLEG